MRSSRRKKSISLILKEFSSPTQEASSMFPIPASKQGNKGDSAIPGTKTKFSRSFIKFELFFHEDADPNDMLEELLKHVGGVEIINHAYHTIKPKYCRINIYLPSKTSEWIQDFCLSTDIISKVKSSCASLGLEFF